jgi:hypothetical protein
MWKLKKKKYDLKKEDGYREGEEGEKQRGARKEWK